MTELFDLRDPIRAKVEALRPEAHFYVTCNPGTPKPGEPDEHYIALCERVYEFIGDQTTPYPGRFVGYVTYRFNEVRRQDKRKYLPQLSSVEVRREDFSRFANGKVHFCPDKVKAGDASLYSLAKANAAANPSGWGSDYDLAKEIGKVQLLKIVYKIVDMIDGKLQ